MRSTSGLKENVTVELAKARDKAEKSGITIDSVKKEHEAHEKHCHQHLSSSLSPYN